MEALIFTDHKPPNTTSKLAKMYLDILDISVGASDYEIELAYKNARSIYTRNNIYLREFLTLDEIDELSKLVCEAYETLRFKKKGDFLKSKYKRDFDFEHKIECQAEFDGKFLKLIRTYKNITLNELSDFTKIKKEFLEAIENHEYNKLPSTNIYLRGFLHQYAKALNLDSKKVVASYMIIKASSSG